MHRPQRCSHLAVLSAGLLASFVAGCGAAPIDESKASRDSVAVTSANALETPVCVTFQRGVNGSVADTQISSNVDKVYKNYGAGLTMIAGKAGVGRRQTLIRDSGVPGAGGRRPRAEASHTNGRRDVHTSTHIRPRHRNARRRAALRRGSTPRVPRLS